MKRQLWDTVRVRPPRNLLGTHPGRAQGKSLLQPIILRTGVFYQNSFSYVSMIRARVLYLPLGDDGRMPHTDLADLGAVRALHSRPSCP